MAKQTRKVNTIKNGTIELVLLLLLQTNKKYGYQLAQEMSELSNGKYELKEATMYPTLYRLNQNGYLDFEQVKQEYDTITSAIDTIISCVSQVDNKNGED